MEAAVNREDPFHVGGAPASSKPYDDDESSVIFSNASLTSKLPNGEAKPAEELEANPIQIDAGSAEKLSVSLTTYLESIQEKLNALTDLSLKQQRSMDGIDHKLMTFSASNHQQFSALKELMFVGVDDSRCESESDQRRQSTFHFSRNAAKSSKPASVTPETIYYLSSSDSDVNYSPSPTIYESLTERTRRRNSGISTDGTKQSIGSHYSLGTAVTLRAELQARLRQKGGPLVGGSRREDCTKSEGGKSEGIPGRRESAGSIISVSAISDKTPSPKSQSFENERGNNRKGSPHEILHGQRRTSHESLSASRDCDDGILQERVSQRILTPPPGEIKVDRRTSAPELSVPRNSLATPASSAVHQSLAMQDQRVEALPAPFSTAGSKLPMRQTELPLAPAATPPPLGLKYAKDGSLLSMPSDPDNTSRFLSPIPSANGSTLYSSNDSDDPKGDHDMPCWHQGRCAPFEKTISSQCESASASLSLGDGLSTPATTHTSTRALLKTTGQENKIRFILLPDSMMCFAFDVLSAWSVLVTGLALPIGFAYLGAESFSHGFLGMILCLVDLTWILGIFANFRTAYVHAGSTETNGKSIARRYVQTWLISDLLAACPMMLATGDSTIVYVLQCATFLRLLRLLPVFLRMKNVCSFNKLYPIAIGVIALLMCNLLTCGWKVTCDGSITTELQGSQGRRLHPNGTVWIHQYVADMYYVIMIMSTVGFGDLHPEGTGQRIYSIVTMLIAPLLFGVIMSLSSNMTQSLFNDKVTAQLNAASRFMRNRKVPQETQRRVQHNLRLNAVQESQMTLAPELLGRLSPAVQRELLSELLRSTVLQFPLFKAANPQFIGEIAQAHTWVHCLPGDVVVEEGQLVQEIVFIIRGKLLVMNNVAEMTRNSGRDGSGDDFVHVESTQSTALNIGAGDLALYAGAWFGELALFEQHRTCPFSAVAVLESELAVLNSSSYLDVLSRYPRVLVRHNRLVQELREGRITAEGFAYSRSTRSSEIKDARGLAKLFNVIANAFHSSGLSNVSVCLSNVRRSSISMLRIRPSEFTRATEVAQSNTGVAPSISRESSIGSSKGHHIPASLSMGSSIGSQHLSPENRIGQR